MLGKPSAVQAPEFSVREASRDVSLPRRVFGVWAYATIVCAVVGAIVSGISKSFLIWLPVLGVWLIGGLIGTLIVALRTAEERSEALETSAPPGFPQLTATDVSFLQKSSGESSR